AGRELIERFYGQDIPGTGRWILGGSKIDPADLGCDTLTISSTHDTIVPQAARPPADKQIALDLGHVGMIVGRAARARLWEPLSDWLKAQS
ncbi:MAG: alpha/beta hydrolase, partial [Sphingobium sp.]